MVERSHSSHVRPVRLPDAGPRDPSPVPRVAASWERSREYGVPLEAVDPVFTGSVDTDSLLFECATQVLRGLQSTLGTEPVSLMVADRDGLVLSRLCTDSAILRSLDAVHLAPGFSYAERTAGTNGLGLSLADRTPTLVRAEEHWCAPLRGYTCAAAPVLDPLDGDVVGTINLTTWSRASSELLLALAQSAAGNTTALMHVRASGRTPRPAAPRGEVFHVWSDRTGGEVDAAVSAPWRTARAEAERAIADGRVVAVVGEPGSGRTTLVSLAHRAGTRRERVLSARAPAPDRIGSWLALWTPELEAPDTCVVVADVDSLPAWAADQLAGVLGAVRRRGPQPFVLTAGDYAAIPASLAALVDSVIEVPPLRLRGADVLPLARHVARQERRRDVGFTTAAERALTGYDWPGNVQELRQVVRAAAARADLVDTHHLDPAVFTPGRHVLTRVETFERDEIVRCLTEPGATVTGAAAELGMSRATIYRKIAQYGITVPSRRLPG